MGQSSRPLDKWGGGGRSPKNFFRQLRTTVWSKNKGGPSPGHHCHVKVLAKNALEWSHHGILSTDSQVKTANYMKSTISASLPRCRLCLVTQRSLGRSVAWRDKNGCEGDYTSVKVLLKRISFKWSQCRSSSTDLRRLHRSLWQWKE